MIDSYTKNILSMIEKYDINNNGVSHRKYFASIIKIPGTNIAMTTDGVGSKVYYSLFHDKEEVIGHDVVAMNVNDLLCVGAKPIGFTNHITMNSGRPVKLDKIIKGILEECKDAEIPLVGGETEILTRGDFHISGAAIGVVKDENIIDGSKVKEGDIILGLKSNGLHSNGWSKLNHVIDFDKLYIQPTRSYTKYILPLLSLLTPSAIVNITGGGFRNLERIKKDNIKFNINKLPVNEQEVFKYVRHNNGNILSDIQLYSIFNMGIGMMMIISPDLVELVMLKLGTDICHEIGIVEKSNKKEVFVNGELVI